VLYVIPIPLAVGTFLFVMAGRDTDYGAALRRQLDERQEVQRLEMQALVGRVLSLAVGISYVVAIAARAVLWPSEILLGLTVISSIAGRLIYGERGGAAARTQREVWLAAPGSLAGPAIRPQQGQRAESQSGSSSSQSVVPQASDSTAVGSLAAAPCQ
jgi:hypothetical protein